MKNKYTFSNLDIVRGIRISLHDEPTIQEIQQMLYDLYAQCYVNPQYLFMSEEDYHFLSHDIQENHARMWMWIKINDLSVGRLIYQIPGPEGLIFVHSLAELDSHVVIVGFVTNF